ncbi:TPA: response regulator transcription factor [Enterobacter ludwigii]|uniref:response regulator transcription factor n=2 Tax=Enterobacteriaceae TaxID=543 RepID=UPI002A8324DB|nr:LuxR C-terminal-related transcriptional regulator [Enterobacter asburiae]
MDIFIISDNQYYIAGVKGLCDMKLSNGYPIRYKTMSYQGVKNKFRSYDLSEVYTTDVLFIEVSRSLNLIGQRFTLRKVFTGVVHPDEIDERVMKNNYYNLNCSSLISEKLSCRELYALYLYRSGFSDEMIAIKMNISKKTVSSHRVNIMSKLNVPNRYSLYLL